MNTYNQQLAQLVEDFINTYDTYLEQPEHLQTPADLQRFLAAHGISGDVVTDEDLDRARFFRDQFRVIWTAPSVNEALHLLNPLLAQIPVAIQLMEIADGLAQVQFDLQPEALRELRPAYQCALGLVAILQTYGLERMRACAAEPCRDVFIDTSRNKTRRFCSDRCANRYNINAFRERHKGTE